MLKSLGKPILPTFASRKISIRKKSDNGDFDQWYHKTAALYLRNDNMNKLKVPLDKYLKGGHVEDRDKRVYFFLSNMEGA